jgi:hypothetical protein
MRGEARKRVKNALLPYRPYQFKYRDETFYLNFNPRKGICTQCDTKGKTHLHHTKYDDDHPLDNTVELCSACHARLTNKQTSITLNEYLDVLITTGKDVRRRKLI